MPSDSSILLLPLLFLLVAGSFVFSAIQTALLTLPAFRLKRLVRRYPHLQKSLKRWISTPRSLLSGIVLADYLVNLPLLLICTALLWNNPDKNERSLWVVALILFGLIFVLCDLLPKLFAVNKPLRVVAFFLPLIRWILPVLAPVSTLMEHASEWLADFLTPRKMVPFHTLTQPEMETLVEMITEEGRLQEEEAEIIRNILKINDRIAKDCMVPRVDMLCIPDTFTRDEIIEQARVTRFRRFPVYHDTPDNIIGVLDIQEYLARPGDSIAAVMQKPMVIPETLNAMKLLSDFLQNPDTLAVIVDEFGGTEGMVTFTDIAEDLIGDAVPRSRAELRIEEIENGRLLVSGDTRLDDLGAYLDTDLEVDGIDTIGGLIFNHMGHLPKAGTTLKIPPLIITIQRLSRKRIESLVVHMPPDGEIEDNAKAIA